MVTFDTPQPILPFKSPQAQLGHPGGPGPGLGTYEKYFFPTSCDQIRIQDDEW